MSTTTTANAHNADEIIALQERDDKRRASNSNENELKPRGQWTSKAEFLLACFGFCIGLGNMWRFPYLCYKNGGGAFLVPYFLCLLFAGAPAVFLEISLGQMTTQGGINAWNLCPIFKGIGYGTTIVGALLNCYYIVVLAWALLYLIYSILYLGTDLPWSRCDQAWNTAACTNDWAAVNKSINSSLPKVDAASEFWERHVLRLSSGIDDIGGINWELAGCLLAVWILCYFCVFKGVKWTGKVVWFTALFPYLLLIVLIIRGVTLPGAAHGLKYYLMPDFSRLYEPPVWIDAGTQIFFSYATSLGALTALGSYNDYNNNCYRDSLLLCGVNSVTSLFSGVAVFTVLGFLSYETGLDIDEVAAKGPGLAFIAYPKAISQLGASGAFSIVFFAMIIVLGLDSQFVGMEGFVTAIVDVFPNYLRRGHRREYFIAIVSAISFLIGLSMVTGGGMYVFQLFDYYAASGMALLWLCIFESVAIGWAYGADRYYAKLESMIGYRPGPWMGIAWRSTSIVFCSFVLCFSIVAYKPLVYNSTYVYPHWAEMIGWLMALSSAVCVPGYAAYAYWSVSQLNPNETWSTKMTLLMHPADQYSIAKGHEHNDEMDPTTVTLA